jgi:ribosomal protein S18 acetylase RimI-like enzyme
MKHKIEPATEEDIPQLADLLGELFALEPYFKPDRAKQLIGLKLIIERPEVGCILVLREGKQVLGMVNLLYTVSTAEGGPAILMEDLIVRAEHRAGGLGTKLLEYAVQLAKDRGMTRITLLTDGNNAGAIRFYQRHGFRLSSMVPMRRHLQEGGVDI